MLQKVKEENKENINKWKQTISELDDIIQEEERVREILIEKNSKLCKGKISKITFKFTIFIL